MDRVENALYNRVSTCGIGRMGGGYWLPLICLVFVTGRGGAGFHSPDPALKRGRGGMFRVIPALPPSGAHPHSFHGRGPVCYHLFLTGARLGYGWGGGLRGDRGRECRKRHPAPGRSVGRGGEKGRGPAFFRAPSAP